MNTWSPLTTDAPLRWLWPGPFPLCKSAIKHFSPQTSNKIYQIGENVRNQSSQNIISGPRENENVTRSEVLSTLTQGKVLQQQLSIVANESRGNVKNDFV